jgi:Mrp family chromosome partitioning ATPase/uncharacterized protein involved in exopolysaccharide biosynthesis
LQLPITAGAPARPNLLRTIGWTIVRHWWLIGLLWTAISAGLLYGVYVGVKPQFEAVSLLRVEPTHRDLFNTNIHAAESFDPFLETQVQLVTSPNVLNAAVSDPRTAGLPSLREAPDAEAEVRSRLQVGVIPKTYLIRVAMTSPSSFDSATVVNGVVDSYLKAAAEWSDGMTRSQIKNLEVYNDELKNQAEELKLKWLSFAAKGNVDSLAEPAPTQAAAPGAPVPAAGRVTIDEYKRVRAELFQVNMELIEAEAVLGQWRAEPKDPDPQSDAGQDRDARLLAAFRADPHVEHLYQELYVTRRKFNEYARVSRSLNDAALRRLRRHIDDLNTELDRQWSYKRGALAKNLGPEDAVARDARVVHQLKVRTESLKAKKDGYTKMLRDIDVANKQEGTDAVKVALVRQELGTVREMQEAVSKRLEQLRYESKADARISRISEARVSSMPVSDHRKKFYAGVPVGVMFAVLGFFVALELRSGRVEDPEVLARLVSLDVHAVPALPEPSAPTRRRSSRQREQVAQDFLRSLDHLRVSLCEDERDSPLGRCLMITSAVAGEGKTTLAGEFAVSCARADIKTLVIDADLRRASLSRTILECTGPGLCDVLNGVLAPEAALVRLPEGFHLLPAGEFGRGQVPGGLLKGHRISRLLAHFRLGFGLVILDTPPVLPVPDALTLGRWTDGAVLVARYGFSRSHDVDRARRQILSAGIPIFKTVVNGVRSSRYYGFGSYYGDYGDDPKSGFPASPENRSPRIERSV